MELSKNIGGKCGNKVFYFANLIDNKLLDKNTIELIFDRDIDNFVNESLSIFLGYIEIINTEIVDGLGEVNSTKNIYNVNATITNIDIDPNFRKVTITILEDLNDYYEDITKPNTVMKALYNGSYDINKFEQEFFNRIPKPLIFQYTKGGALFGHSSGTNDNGISYTHRIKFNMTKQTGKLLADTTMYDFAEIGKDIDLIVMSNLIYTKIIRKIETSSTFTVVDKYIDIDVNLDEYYTIFLNIKSGELNYINNGLLDDFVYSSNKFTYDNTKSPADIDVELYDGFNKPSTNDTYIQYYTNTDANNIVFTNLQVGSVYSIFGITQYFRKYDDSEILYTSAKTTTHTVTNKDVDFNRTDGTFDVYNQFMVSSDITLYKQGVDKFEFPHYIKNTKLV